MTLIFETVFHVVQTGLKLTVWPRMTMKTDPPVYLPVLELQICAAMPRCT